MNKYAPVLIPTLDRYEHLKQCLESLSRCTLADFTEVYVALDFPPSEKHVEGWKKNKAFLKSCGNMGFKKLNLIERDHNYGIWTSELSNISALIQEATQNTECYIISEDDNVFSPNFLDYMNKGFEKFKDDEHITSICGYRYYVNINSDDNTFFFQNVDYCAWGCGVWKAKLALNTGIYDYHYFRQHLSIRNVVKVYRRGGLQRVANFLSLCNNQYHGPAIDIVQTIYMVLNDQYQVMPTLSTVKNIGISGGINYSQCSQEIQDKFNSAPVDVRSSFTFIGTGWEHFKENQIIYREEYPNHPPIKTSFLRIAKNLVKILIYR